MGKARTYKRKMNGSMRGGFYNSTTTTSPNSNTNINPSPSPNANTNGIMGFFNDAWKKTKETSQNMISSMNKPTTTTNTSSSNMQPSYPTTTRGGKRSRRKRGGYYTPRPFTGAPVSHIKMARPTYWMTGGKTRRVKKRKTRTSRRSKK
jgi:hypothetical protein